MLDYLLQNKQLYFSNILENILLNMVLSLIHFLNCSAIFLPYIKGERSDWGSIIILESSMYFKEHHENKSHVFLNIGWWTIFCFKCQSISFFASNIILKDVIHHHQRKKCIYNLWEFVGDGKLNRRFREMSISNICKGYA